MTYENKQISKIYNTKFLALVIGNNLSWGFHSDEIVPKHNKTCYVIGSVNKIFITFEVLRMTYFCLVHSVISYSIIFGGNTSHIKDIFNIQVLWFLFILFHLFNLFFILFISFIWFIYIFYFNYN
jgi:hypothetical protein